MDSTIGQNPWRSVGIQPLLSTYLSSLVSFVFLFTLVAWGIRNEIALSRRVILWARLVVMLLAVCDCAQLFFDAIVVARITLPSLRIVRPVLGLVLALLAFFVNAHAVFRWLVALTQPAFVVACTYTAVEWAAELECRLAGTCLKQGGYSAEQLEALIILQCTTAFLAIWLTLAAAYLLIALGACGNRYPVRLVSSSLVGVAAPAATNQRRRG